MTQSGWATDQAAMSELFSKEPATLKQINDLYLVPRWKAMKEGRIDSRGDRNHWLRNPRADSAVAKIDRQEAARILGREKIKALEKTPKAMVGVAVAACYCGISEKELNERYIALGREMCKDKKTGEVPKGEALLREMAFKGWTSKVKGKTTGKRGNQERRFWQVAFLNRIKKGSTNSVIKQRSAKSVKSLGSNTLVIPWSLVQAASKKTLKVVAPDGRIVCDLLFTGIPENVLMGFLTSGATLQLMTVRDSLTRPWVNMSERQCWEDAWHVWLEREHQVVISGREISRWARAEIEESSLEETLQATNPAPRPPPIRPRP